ncbi:phospholipase-like protein [Tanacetum coccineum]
MIANVNGHNLHFERCEFCLVTGFKFGMVSFCEYMNGDILFRNRLFREKIGNDVKIIDVLALIEDEEKLRMVNNLDAWNTFPWGEHIWRQLYDSIRNVSSKQKLEHLDGLRKNPNHVPSYSLSGFLFCFQGLYGEYLNKRSAARAAKQKDSEEFHTGLRGRKKGRKAALIDRARDLEGLCESLLTLPKEVKSLRGRICKLESIIQVITLKTNRVEKEESLNKFGPQIEDLLKSTSEDELYIKDNTSKIVEKDVGDVYCCDVNGHVPGVLMPSNPVSQPIYEDFSFDLAVLNGFCNLSQNEDKKGDCEIIRLADQRQQDDISKMADEAEQKIESEIQRLYNHREARLNKIAKEEKQRKFIGHMNSFAHMKLAIKRCVPKKRKYVNVMRSPFSGLSETLNVPSMEQLANQKNVLNPLMIEKCKSVKPWIEHGLCGLDDNRKGWLVDEHIELWIMYMWHTRPSDMDWAMVSSYFLPLLLRGSTPKFYANNAIYLVGWSNVERVFIPINEPKRHWSLAIFHICSGIAFYDSEKTIATHDKEFRPWYLKMRQCLEEKILVVLKETGVFRKKNIDPAKYKISFRHADHVPKQGGVFGDCGVFLLAYGIPLVVDDPVKVALAYREKMIRFYF